MSKITEQDRENIKNAMAKKVQEMNGRIGEYVDEGNEQFKKDVIGQKKKFNPIDVLRLAKVDPQSYSNIIYGVIRETKDRDKKDRLDYYRLVKYFGL